MVKYTQRCALDKNRSASDLGFAGHTAAVLRRGDDGLNGLVGGVDAVTGVDGQGGQRNVAF